jgi:hypothetical protein
VEATAVEATPHSFTVAEFMSLDTERRTELLDGVVFDVSPHLEPHRYAVRRLTEVLVHAFFGTDLVVRVQDAIAVPGWDGHDAPETDVAVLRRKEFHPGPTSADAVACIEVSDLTYGGTYGDRHYKIPLYVNAGVPAWIVNIRLRQVEFYGLPSHLAVKHGHVFREGDTFDVLGVTIVVAELFVNPDHTRPDAEGARGAIANSIARASVSAEPSASRRASSGAA